LLRCGHLFQAAGMPQYLFQVELCMCERRTGAKESGSLGT
jgi:hypothetical protein